MKGNYFPSYINNMMEHLAKTKVSMQYSNAWIYCNELAYTMNRHLENEYGVYFIYAFGVSNFTFSLNRDYPILCGEVEFDITEDMLTALTLRYG